MKKIMVLDTNYPSEENLYGDSFVHSRVKEYQKYSEVLVVSFFRDLEDYEYEGVKVVHAPEMKDVERIHNDFSPHYLFIHFYNRRLYEFVKKIHGPVVIWVHGYEALGWYRRLFNFTSYEIIRNAHSIILPNIRQMIGFRKLVKLSNGNDRVKFIFVSDWMRRVAETDSLSRIKNYSVISNPIDINLFKYREKAAEQRKRILMIRSFASHKYANDIAIKVILLLKDKSFFKDLQFCIYGRGKHFKSLTRPIEKFPNIFLKETFIKNSDIPDIHKEYGLFLCPTRQDAQGVSMCEAMSSGLVPITSNCTAIPEFVKNGCTGVVSDTPDQMAAGIEEIYYNPSLFLDISRKASESINEKCAVSKIVERELAVINFKDN